MKSYSNQPYKSLKPIKQINLTPLIDITFILLIFFIISYQKNDIRGYKINIPQEEKADKIKKVKENQIIIRIKDKDRISLNKDKIKIKELKSILAKLKNKNKEIIILSDAKVKIQLIISIFDIIKSSGIKKSPILQTRKKKIIKNKHQNSK